MCPPLVRYKEVIMFNSTIGVRTNGHNPQHPGSFYTFALCADNNAAIKDERKVCIDHGKSTL